MGKTKGSDELMTKEDLTGLVWWAKERVRGFMTGLHKSPDFGFSLDFAQHRAYVPGDSPKFIDWNLLARQDKFLTKQFEAESNLRAYFLLDSSASMFSNEGSKWSYAVKLIALSGALLTKQRDALGLLEVREGEVSFFESKNTGDSLERLLGHISSRDRAKGENGNIVAGIHRLLDEAPPRSELLFLTDVYHDNLDALCKQLGAAVDAGHYLRVVVIISKERELDTSFYHGRYVLDPETGRKTTITREEAHEMKKFVEHQFDTLRKYSSLYGFALTQVYLEDEPLVSFQKLMEA